MKTRRKRSLVWTLPREQFELLVKKSKSIADICRELGFAVTGKCHKLIKERIAAEQIDASHIPLGVHCNIGRRFASTAVPLESVMVENSFYDRKDLKRRVIAAGILKNECAICGQAPEWHGLKLVMVLDHINGVRNDSRKENLRLLCPNCNSQQSTFAGRNRLS